MRNKKLEFVNYIKKIKPVLIVILSGMSTGLFFWDTVHNLLGLNLYYHQNLLLFAYLLLFPAFFICLWLGYSKAISKLSSSNFNETLAKDAVTYLPLFIVLLFPIRYFVIDQEIPYSHLPSVTLMVLSFSLFFTLKVLFLNIDINRKSSDTWLKSKSNIVFAFLKNRLIYILIAAYVITFATLSILRYSSFNMTSFDLATGKSPP